MRGCGREYIGRPSGIWSRWAKPVLFSQLDRITPQPIDLPSLVSEVDLAAVPDPSFRTALVINLPGAQSVAVGVALAQRGYQPVPLFNSTSGSNPHLLLTPILDALVTGQKVLEQLSFLLSPPAFLIDSNRLQGQPQPGQFDNRWVVFPQDFPSAIFLRSQEISRIVVVQGQTVTFQQDLAQVLSLWAKGGLEVLEYKGQGAPEPMRLGRYRRFWAWSGLMFVAFLGLRRSSAGGFGGIRPYPSSG